VQSQDLEAKPKRKSRIETERKIFEAGRSVFAELGFEGASLKRIAKTAGVNEALIIRYYGSKAKLLTAILLYFYEQMQQVLRSDIPEYDSLEAELEAHLLREIESDFENVDLLQIAIVQASLDTKFKRQMLGLFAEEAAVLAARFKRFQARQQIAADADVKALSQMIQHYTYGLGTTIALNPQVDQALLVQQARSFATIFVRGLRAQV
jgi:AcrR family transcriptional regulator